MSDTAEVTRYFAMECTEQQEGARFAMRYSGDPEQVAAIPSDIKVTCFGCLGEHIATECTEAEWDAINDSDEPGNELHVTAGGAADA